MFRCGVLIVSVLLCATLVAGEAMWPKPQKETPTGTEFQLALRENFVFKATGPTNDILTAAFERYAPLVYFSGSGSSKANLDIINAVEVTLQSPSMDLSLQTDENYTLSVAAPASKISAGTVFGALRALETFSQLVSVANGVYLINGTTVSDFPRFAHRGLMIDTSRHYLRLPTIYATIDALAYSKMNVLHWHIVDSQSFPYVSTRFPALSRDGAWPLPEHIYTPNDIQSVIKYAHFRGVRVLAEFDTPGHSESWGKGQPGLLTDCYDKSGKPTGTVGPIDPSKNSTFDFLTALFTEIVSVFPDHYVHLGGDEVSFSCWESNPHIQQFMAEKGWTDYGLLENYYEQRLLAIMAGLNHGYVVWEEIFDNGVQVRPDTVIHVWKGNWNVTMSKVTKAGLQAIVSSPWYLNYISYGEDWKTYYLVEPTAFDGSDAQKELVVGGEACMWGEYVDDTNALSRTWVRASAVGERLWSSKTTTDLNDASLRINAQRCRYVRRGIQAEPILGPGYCENEWQPQYSPPWQ